MNKSEKTKKYPSNAWNFLFDLVFAFAGYQSVRLLGLHCYMMHAIPNRK